MRIVNLTKDEYNAIMESREQLNELFGFGKKKDNLSNAKNNAVSSIKNTANDIDEEKKRREEMRNKLMAMKKPATA